MATKKLKKKVQRKPAARKAANPVVDAAREFWLAGLGAFSYVQDEGMKVVDRGNKLFDQLVKEGTKVENKARKDLEGTFGEIRNEIETRVREFRNDLESAVSEFRGEVESRVGDVRKDVESRFEPVLVQGKIQKEEKGAKLIVIDPRRSESAEAADLWLQLRPGTDCALLLGMINIAAPVLGALLLAFLPWLVLIGVYVWFWRRVSRNLAGGVGRGGEIDGFLKPRDSVRAEPPKVSFDDVAGQDNAKRGVTKFAPKRCFEDVAFIVVIERAGKDQR